MIRNSIPEKGFRIDRPIQKLYFETKEVGEIIGEVDSVIRFWAKAFNIYRKWVPFKEYWLYPRPSVAKFHVIKYLLRIEKYTVAGAKIKLKQL